MNVDAWFDNEHVAVHWWEVITSTATTGLLSMLVESFNPTTHNFVGILEVSSLVSWNALDEFFIA